jgi:hypothetical protein
LDDDSDSPFHRVAALSNSSSSCTSTSASAGDHAQSSPHEKVIITNDVFERGNKTSSYSSSGQTSVADMPMAMVTIEGKVASCSHKKSASASNTCSSPMQQDDKVSGAPSPSTSGSCSRDIYQDCDADTRRSAQEAEAMQSDAVRTPSVQSVPSGTPASLFADVSSMWSLKTVVSDAVATGISIVGVDSRESAQEMGVLRKKPSLRERFSLNTAKK